MPVTRSGVFCVGDMYEYQLIESKQCFADMRWHILVQGLSETITTEDQVRESQRAVDAQ
jgi:hypothetical protein